MSADRLEELRVEQRWTQGYAKAAVECDMPCPNIERKAALLAWAVARIEALEGEKAFLASKGLTVGMLKDGHGERLSYAIEPGSELDDTATIIKLTDAEIALASAERREGEAVAVLRKAEWAGAEFDNTEFCPICGKRRVQGHAPDCRLAKTLGGKGATP